MIWLRTIAWLLPWALLALIAWAVDGARAATFIFAVGLLAVLCWHILHLHRLIRWTTDLSVPPPPTSGGWSDPMARLYRHIRTQDRELTFARDTMGSLLAAAQSLPDGAVMLDENFRIDWCNRVARQHLGLRLPADRGRKLLDLMRTPEFVRYAQQPDWPEPMQMAAPGHHGRILQVQITTYAVRQRLLLTRDVTQLERLETTRRDFVANVSHELRTPLTVLAGFVETLRDLPPDAIPEAQRNQYLDLMQEQSRRMQSIVADLLTLSTLESSPATDHPKVIDMQALIGVARQQAEALSNGRHQFDWQITRGLDLFGTETEMASGVSNLLINAVRYTPGDGRITVRWELCPDGHARFTVIDTGIGIEAQHLPRLTERFYRVDRSRSRSSGGTGLGLAITKHVAMRHDAELEIRSEPGKGSSFALVFPPERLAISESAPAPTPAPAPAPVPAPFPAPATPTAKKGRSAAAKAAAAPAGAASAAAPSAATAPTSAVPTAAAPAAAAPAATAQATPAPAAATPTTPPAPATDA